MPLKNKLGAILFWSVISAAFIGPGTVTTAAAAGAGFGLDLVWVLVVSTFACVVLQVNVTRISIDHDKNLGELLNEKFQKLRFIPGALGISVIFGCAAYQAGNLLGASLGVSLLSDIDARWILLVIVAFASSMLWFGSVQAVVRILGTIVAMMGVAFIIIAFSVDFDLHEIIGESLIPKVPIGAEVMVMGLIGTTIVPYNLFLGSGLSKGRELSSSVFGLVLAISLGGLISIAILLVGTLVVEPFGFEKLSGVLSSRMGSGANWLLGIGLFSAGFTSAMTAPLAAVFTYKSVFTNKKKSRSGRSIWMLVMGSGLVFGFFSFKPIPVIIMAQALNGLVLPFITGFILYIVANRKRMAGMRDIFDLSLLSLVVFLAVVAGSFSLIKLWISPGLLPILSCLLFSIITVLSILYVAMIRKHSFEK
jgi:Mn2+/Fe2+ NRAMP family transporter